MQAYLLERDFLKKEEKQIKQNKFEKHQKFRVNEKQKKKMMGILNEKIILNAKPDNNIINVILQNFMREANILYSKEWQQYNQVKSALEPFLKRILKMQEPEDR